MASNSLTILWTSACSCSVSIRSLLWTCTDLLPAVERERQGAAVVVVIDDVGIGAAVAIDHLDDLDTLDYLSLTAPSPAPSFQAGRADRIGSSTTPAP